MKSYTLGASSSRIRMIVFLLTLSSVIPAGAETSINQIKTQFGADLRVLGQVQYNDAVKGVINVVGQRIEISRQTVFLVNHVSVARTGAELQSIMPGDMLAVFGPLDSPALSIDRLTTVYVPGSTVIYVRGAISAVDKTLGVAKVNELGVDYTPALYNSEALSLAAGQVVEAVGIQTSPAGKLLAEQLSISGTKVAESGSISGTSVAKPTSISGTSVMKAESISGTSVVKADSISGTSVAKPTSISGTSVAKPTSISGTSVAKPTSISGTSVAKADSISGTSVVKPDSISGTSVAKADSISGTSMAKADSISGTSVVKADSISGTSVAKADSISGTSVVKADSIIGAVGKPFSLRL